MRLFANCTFVPHCYTKPAKMVRAVIIGTLAYLYNNANLLTGLCACACVRVHAAIPSRTSIWAGGMFVSSAITQKKMLSRETFKMDFWVTTTSWSQTRLLHGITAGEKKNIFNNLIVECVLEEMVEWRAVCLCVVWQMLIFICKLWLEWNTSILVTYCMH